MGREENPAQTKPCHESFYGVYKHHVPLIAILTAVVLVAASIGCGGGSSAAPPPPPTISVSISPTAASVPIENSILLKKGKPRQEGTKFVRS